MGPDHSGPDRLGPDRLGPDHLGPDHLGPKRIERSPQMRDCSHADVLATKFHVPRRVTTSQLWTGALIQLPTNVHCALLLSDVQSVTLESVWYSTRLHRSFCPGTADSGVANRSRHVWNQQRLGRFEMRANVSRCYQNRVCDPEPAARRQ